MSTSYRLLPNLTAQTPINALIGDESWTATCQTPPRSADEVTRIRTHLTFVHDRLRAANTSHLTTDQRARRARALADLAEYAEAGIFPRRARGDGHGTRTPRFIDDRGVHCAVGELIRRSGHPELARSIDDGWEYALVPDIASPELAAWADAHGFEARELAMIQPMYAPTDPVGLFMFTFVLAGIVAGWIGFLASLLCLIPVRPRIGWVRVALIALGGWPFCGAAIAFVTAFDAISPPLALAALVVLQIGYTWGGYELAKAWPKIRASAPPLSQRAMLTEALADLKAESQTAVRAEPATDDSQRCGHASSTTKPRATGSQPVAS